MAKEKQKAKQKSKTENIMRKIEIEKVVLNCGGIGEKLERSVRLLRLLTGKKVKEVISVKRIPSFDVRPGLKTGCTATIRGKEKEELLKRLLQAVDNKLKKKKIAENHFAFGIKEYLEIPNMEYQRDIGILGLDIDVAFKRKGKRIALKKIKQGRLPKKQHVSPEEIIEFLKNKFNTEVE